MIALIIPILNEEYELPECLWSLLSQREPNFKLFLVDNGSTDKSETIIEEFVNLKVVDVKYLKEPRVGKVYALRRALNVIIDDPEIDVIAFSDADCFFEPDWSITVENFFKVNQERAFGYSLELFKGDGLKSAPNFKKVLLEYTKNLYYARKEIGGYMQLNNCFVRKDTFYDVGGFGNWEKSLDTLLTIKLTANGYNGDFCNAKCWTSPRRIIDGNIRKWCNDVDIRVFTRVRGFKTWKPVRLNNFSCCDDISSYEIRNIMKKRCERLFRRLIILYLFSDKKNIRKAVVDQLTKVIEMNSAILEIIRLIIKLLSPFGTKISYNIVDGIVRKGLIKEISLGGQKIYERFVDRKLESWLIGNEISCL